MANNNHGDFARANLSYIQALQSELQRVTTENNELRHHFAEFITDLSLQPFRQSHYTVVRIPQLANVNLDVCYRYGWLGEDGWGGLKSLVEHEICRDNVITFSNDAAFDPCRFYCLEGLAYGAFSAHAVLNPRFELHCTYHRARKMECVWVTKYYSHIPIQEGTQARIWL
ncbi:hypothetical protein F53441_4216 [Fusarium austroafricanum]|uniref:Uncharacterized protein n=1 Tax=Fusarium austroafricanum TaxID=2364996 RepID=A0A8H4NZ04_9HYPO|nr:hypothetical protein F53441_4216 [Fusarium austroafricanum]